MRTWTLLLDIAVTVSVCFECELVGNWFVAGERDVEGTGFEWSKDADANHGTVPVRPKTDPVEDAGYTHDGQVQATLGSAWSVSFFALFHLNLIPYQRALWG
jgi:hypothetical protein